jgi:hypothetical protein
MLGKISQTIFKIWKYLSFQETALWCLEISDISEIFVVTNKAQKLFVIEILEKYYLRF